MNPKVKAKLQKQIQTLLGRGLTPQQVYDRLFFVTFGETTAKQLVDLINNTTRGYHSEVGKYRRYEPEISKLKTTKALSGYLDELFARGEINETQWEEIYNSYKGMISSFNAEREAKLLAQQSEKEAAELQRNSILGYASLPGEVKNYLQDFRNPQDLEARIRQLDALGYGYLDQNAKADLYDSFMADYNADRTKQLQQWAAATNKAELERFGNQSANEYRAGQQRSQGVLNAFQGAFQPQQTANNFQPEDIGGLVKTFRGELGSSVGGGGTRLRSFIESGLGEDIEGTLDARQKWVQAMNAPQPLSYGDRLSGLQQNIARNLAISQDPNLTASSIGNVYWGEGGPARIAREAYERQIKEIEGLNPDDYPEPEPYKGVDPLKSLLEDPEYLKRKRAEYNRLPGVMRQVVAPVRYR